MTKPDRKPVTRHGPSRSVNALRLRGAAALMEALEVIGAEGATDHDMAAVVVENELELRELLSWALRTLSEEAA